MKTARLFCSAALGGMGIGLGGMAFLPVEEPIIGGALFALGLFSVCTFGLVLFYRKFVL